MKKTFKTILFTQLTVVLLDCIGFGAFYFTRFQTMATLERLTEYEDGYADKVDPDQDNGMYGKGSAKKRYTAMLDVLEANKGTVDRDAAWEDRYTFEIGN